MITHKVSISLVIAVICFSAKSQQVSETCTTEQAQMSSIDIKYKPKYTELENKGKQLEKDTPPNDIKLNFKTEMKEQKWRFNLPSITMKRNEIVMGIPQTTMKTQRWSYDLPVVIMERRKIGQHPETTCSYDNWNIPYDCRVTWHDNYIDVPVTRMQPNEIKIDIPEFIWINTKMSWDIPQLTWVENNWIVKIPEFTLVNINVEKGKDLKARSDDMTKEAAQITAARNLDTRAVTSNLYSCFRSEIAKQQSNVEKQMDEGISNLKATIKNIQAQGADPTKVPSSGGQSLNLIATLDDLIKKKAEAISGFKNAAQELDDSEKKTFAQL
jgi:hypothetical protein